MPVDEEEITGIVCTKKRIITVGWSKKVAIYKDSRDEQVNYVDFYCYMFTPCQLFVHH